MASRDNAGQERRQALERIEVVDVAVAAVLRSKSGMERLRMAHEAWELAQHRLATFLGARHPELSPEQIRRLVAGRFRGDAG